MLLSIAYLLLLEGAILVVGFGFIKYAEKHNDNLKTEDENANT